MADPDGRIGTVLDGRYRIVEPLSKGGMGVVYRAERIPVGRPVAIKFLHALFADDPDSRVRFERETRALSKLTHPHCVGIIDFGFEGQPYLVMDLVAGATLREIIDDGPMQVDDAIALTRQLLAGLAHAHEEGIVHRDVKPANVMVTDEIGTGRHARILDFGLARLREHGAAGSASSITQQSIVVGTPSYMAPEQTLGSQVDARTDVYAVGILLFEMLTGQRPFAAEDTGSLLEMHRKMPAPHLDDVDPTRKWPNGLDAVIQRALSKDPADRWPGAVAFSSALDAVARGDSQMRMTRPLSQQQGNGNAGSMRFLVVLFLLGAVGIAAYVGFGGGKKKSAASSGGGGGGGAAMGVPGGDAGAAIGTRENVVRDDAGRIVMDLIDVTDAGPFAITTEPADPAAVAAEAAAALAAQIDAAPEPVITPTDLDAGTATANVDVNEEDIQLEPLPAADPEIELVEPQPEPPDETSSAAGGVVTPPIVEPTPPTPPAARPAIKTVAQALARARAGHRDEAIAGLRALWKKSPKSASIPYVLGNLYTEKRWWSVAMEHYQAAIKRGAAYRRNATLIRNVISMLGSPRTRGQASWFLRKTVGAPAKAHLRTAAKRHKSVAVRKQSAAVLRRF
ncbi:MAG TPA: serine/threonine-protein kinase [Kofleriaceae bacterium]|nr:serine/threonine-protein kinase [Kofleriaceae bacterium]